MTIMVLTLRVLAQPLLSRSHLLARAGVYANPLLRVATKYRSNQGRLPLSQEFVLDYARPLQCHTYATSAAAKPASRPKAHTGRAPAKRSRATTATTNKKPGPKTGAGKVKPRKRAAAKPRAKKRTVGKTATKKLEVTKARDLKEKALLSPPKRLPQSAWSVIFAENAVKGAPVSGAGAKSAAQKYKNLSPEEHERYNHTANENKAKNTAEFKRWLSTYPPLRIKEANAARNQLRRQAKKAGKKTTYPHIQDERLVKQARNAYSFFLSDRVASGDMNNMKVGEIGGLVGREWKSLSASHKKKFDDMAATDKNRYLAEYKSVYGVDPPSKAKK